MPMREDFSKMESRQPIVNYKAYHEESRKTKNLLKGQKSLSEWSREHIRKEAQQEKVSKMTIYINSTNFFILEIFFFAMLNKYKNFSSVKFFFHYYCF